jgi:Na+-driven multidrug efflux pump
LALRYARQVLPTAPLIGMGMCCSALLRSVGDARGAMALTLFSGAASAVLDPLCIFGLGLGLDGAALSQWCARSALVALGLWMVLKKHDLLRLPSPAVLRETLPTFMAIGLPAVLTQIATPVGNAFVTHAIAPFGDDAVAGWSVVVRLIPLAFVVLFALSGAIGPIVGQNLGAGRFDRLRQTLRQSLTLVLVYVAIVWLLLALGANLIADAFGAQGEAREVIVFFCRFVAGSFAFNGALFVANAAFNNLGFAFYSTALNWGRATLGVAPFVWVGATLGGTQGIMAGYGLGVVGFGAIGIWLCFKTLDRLGHEAV